MAIAIILGINFTLDYEFDVEFQLRLASTREDIHASVKPAGCKNKVFSVVDNSIDICWLFFNQITYNAKVPNGIRMDVESLVEKPVVIVVRNVAYAGKFPRRPYLYRAIIGAGYHN